MEAKKDNSIKNYKIIQRDKDGYYEINQLIDSVNKLENKKIDFNQIEKKLIFNEEVKYVRKKYKKEPIIKQCIVNTSKGRIKRFIWVHPTLFLSVCFDISQVLKYHLLKDINILKFLDTFNVDDRLVIESQKLYLIHDSFTNNLKIGRSFDPEKRAKQLSFKSSGKLSILCSIDNSGELETVLHKKFKKYRIHGEWFENVKEIHDEFNKIKYSTPF